MLRGLDRDFPEGQAEFSFTVYAEDARSRERLGSANVFVILKGNFVDLMSTRLIAIADCYSYNEPFPCGSGQISTTTLHSSLNEFTTAT